MNQLLIIDALNLIRRLYAALSAQGLSDWRGALHQSLSQIIRTFITQSHATHAIAVFDAEGNSWRHDLYPEYKAGRTPMPEELAEEMEALQDTLFSLGIDSLISADDEADDLIATLATNMARHQQRALIVSTDKGFCQLLAPEITIRDYFNRRWLDEEFVRERYGVSPTQLVDFWALAGVSGSHIHGVKGVGVKSATTLLQRYGSLAGILAASAEEDRLVAKVHAERAEAELAKRLVTLKCDCELGFNLKALRLPRREES